MDDVTFIIFVIIGIFLGRLLMGPNSAGVKKKCTLHKWEYKEDKSMHCITCGFIPNNN